MLDCELLPWSAKAVELIERQYAAVGAAARAGARRDRRRCSSAAAARGLDVAALRRSHGATASRASSATATPTGATSGRSPASRTCGSRRSTCSPPSRGVFVERDHGWHLDALRRARRRRPRLDRPHRPPRRRRHRPRERGRGDRVVGGADRGRRRGHGRQAARVRRARREGPRPAGREVPRPRVPADHLRPRVRRARPARPPALARASAASARSRSREFALGVEALERFVRREPLYRVHECVFGVLALESEPVDPRL